MSDPNYLDATLTDAGIRNGYLDLEARYAPFFPTDSIGDRSGDRKGMSIGLQYDGKTVDTDVRMKSEATISPRHRFGSWFKSLRAVPGDLIRVHRAGPRRYRLEHISGGGRATGSPPAAAVAPVEHAARPALGSLSRTESRTGKSAPSIRADPSTITQGLVIADPWVDLILSGRKTWEIRGESVSKRGHFAILRKGTGTIAGVANLVDSIGPLSLDELRATNHLHAVPIERFAGEYRYETPFAWVLDGAIRLESPLPYRHPSGAVKWVNLDRATLDALVVRLGG